MAGPYTKMRIFLGELLKRLEANEIISVEEVLGIARQSDKFLDVEEKKLKAALSTSINYYKRIGAVNYEIPGYIERTGIDFVIKPEPPSYPPMKERVESLIELVKNNPSITNAEILQKGGFQRVLKKTFGNLSTLKRALRIDEKYIQARRFRSLKDKLSPAEVDEKFFKFIDEEGRVPTYEEFKRYDVSALGFIVKGFYPGVSGWTQYVESKGYKTYDTRGKLDEATIRRLYQKGLNDTEMAEKLGVNRKAIVYWRNKLGLPPHFKKEYSISKSLLLRTLRETGSFAGAAKKLGVKPSLIESKARKYGIKSPFFIYDDIISILEQKGPRTVSQIMSDLKYKGYIDMRGAKKHGVLSTKIPGSQEHLYYLRSQTKQAEALIESIRQNKIQKLFNYLRSHPDATYEDVKEAGLVNILIRFFDNRINKAKKAIGLPCREYKRVRHNVFQTVSEYLKEHGPSLTYEIACDCNLSFSNITSLAERKKIKSVRVPGYRFKLNFLSGQEEIAERKRVYLINSKKLPLIKYLKENPNCTRRDVVNKGYEMIIKLFYHNSLVEAKKTILK